MSDLSVCQERWTKEHAVDSSSSFSRMLVGVVLVFLFVYAPTHSFSSLSFALIPVMWGYLVMMMKSKVALQLLFAQRNVRVVYLLSFGAVCGLLSTLIMAGEDLYFPLLMAKAILVYIPVSLGLMLYICGENAESCFDTMAKLLFFAAMIQAIAILLQFIFPEFNLWTSEFILERGNIESLHEFRFRGISDAGGSGVSLMQGFAVFLGCYCAWIEKHWAHRLVYLSGFLILPISATLVGRTGVIVGLFGLFLSICYVVSRRKQILVQMFIVLGIGILGLSFLSIFLGEQIDFYKDVVVQYAFEPIINYTQGGTFSSGSTQDLLTMLYLPESVTHLLLGVGAFDFPGHGLMQTDSGYLKTLLSSGLVGLLVTYGAFLLMFSYIISAVRKSAKVIFLVAFAGLIVAEIKEPFLYQNAISRCLWILFSAALYDQFRKARSQKLPG